MWEEWYMSESHFIMFFVFLCHLKCLNKRQSIDWLTDGQRTRKKKYVSVALWTDEQISCKGHPLHQSTLFFVSIRPSISIKTLITYNRIMFLKQHAVSVLTQHSWATGLRTAGGKEGGGGNFKSSCMFTESPCFPSSVEYPMHTHTQGEGPRGFKAPSINLGVTTSCGSSSHILLPIFYFIRFSIYCQIKLWKYEKSFIWFCQLKVMFLFQIQLSLTLTHTHTHARTQSI